jgi:hypothetical protein
MILRLFTLVRTPCLIWDAVMVFHVPTSLMYSDRRQSSVPPFDKI